MAKPTSIRDDLCLRLDEAKARWSDHQFQAFTVMCYRSIEPFLSDAAQAAVNWVVSDLQGQAPDASLNSVLQSLQWDTIDPDAARAGENRFSFNVLKLLEEPPLEAAKSAVLAVAAAADLQAIYARSQVSHSDTNTRQKDAAVADFNKRLALSQIVGLLDKIDKIETDLSSINLSSRTERTDL